MRHVDMVIYMHAMRRDVHTQHAIMQHARMRSQYCCMHVDQATDRLVIKLKIKERKAQPAKRSSFMGAANTKKQAATMRVRGLLPLPSQLLKLAHSTTDLTIAIKANTDVCDRFYDETRNAPMTHD